MNWLMPAGRRGAAGRFLLAAVIVILFTAATTAVAGLLDIKQGASELGQQAGLDVKGVTIPAYGAPETLLLIGSDHRAGEPYRSANTDTMMLVRIDGSSQTINALSVPRDLRVLAPAGGAVRLNALYSIGGPNLLLNTLKTQVLPGLHVNHVIDVNFRAFSDLIDAIGCVYADVDHRYYNDTALTGYSSIDIQPGYQRLCGANQSVKGALAFVRFRHTDSDLVRNARQQAFLRWAKDNYTGAELFANRHGLLRIFGRNAQTDATLHSSDALESLLVLAANAAGHQLKSIPFPAQFQVCGAGGQTPCYVTADAAAESAAYRAFMTPTRVASVPRPAAPARASSGKPQTGAAGRIPAGLMPDPADGQSQAKALARAGLPVLYPKLIQAGSRYCSSLTGNCDTPGEPVTDFAASYPRHYHIFTGGHAYASYRMTIVVNSALGLYYGVQGTAWANPPILAHGVTPRTVNGRKLLLYFSGHDKLSIAAWRRRGAVYWISNTLTDSIPVAQMTAIAASLSRG
ncbi:MAG TPA: LCP family protein [Solirubrobacteraceae bacterium]|nr:LCP family protein [Solirubrobacteraceae bacterium]